jgi:prevent-host-death family protein
MAAMRETKTVSLTELRARISEIMRFVKAGGEVFVTERGKLIARTLPADSE